VRGACIQCAQLSLTSAETGSNYVIVGLVWLTALRIHISKPCYIGLLEIGGYEMTLRGEMNVKVSQRFGHQLLSAQDQYHACDFVPQLCVATRKVAMCNSACSTCKKLHNSRGFCACTTLFFTN